MKQSDYTLVPIANVIAPHGGIQCCMKDRWWAILDGDYLMFYGRGMSPQCNTSREIVEHLDVGGGCFEPGRIGIGYLQQVFIPIKMYGDYDYNVKSLTRNCDD